jgi:hypothetical protein
VLGKDGWRSEGETQQFDYLYHVREYAFKGQRRFLAFGGGYNYCGDLTEDAFDWLRENALKEEQDFTGVQKGQGKMRAPRNGRDRISSYHPVMREGGLLKGYWFDKVRDSDKHRAMLTDPKPKDLTHQKILSQRPL